jgi:transcriptional regulator with XRE-family HTH domain
MYSITSTGKKQFFGPRFNPFVSHTGSQTYAINLRRLMARFGLTIREVVERTALDPRTVKGLLEGSAHPHASTLHQLASGLNVDVDELFQTGGSLAFRTFDRQSNPAIDDVVAQHPEWFADWSMADFSELASHVGVGGALTPQGVVEAARRMNRKRAALRKTSIIMETDLGSILEGVIGLLYDRAIVSGEPQRAHDRESFIAGDCTDSGSTRSGGRVA